jgi:hypothetical protein
VFGVGIGNVKNATPCHAIRKTGLGNAQTSRTVQQNNKNAKTLPEEEASSNLDLYKSMTYTLEKNDDMAGGAGAAAAGNGSGTSSSRKW